jgi:hypothetical protein
MTNEHATSPDPRLPLAPCPECGGECVTAQMQPHTFGVQRAGAFVRGISTVFAVVCLGCGLIRLYATQPEKVLPQS